MISLAHYMPFSVQIIDATVFRGLEVCLWNKILKLIRELHWSCLGIEWIRYALTGQCNIMKPTLFVPSAKAVFMCDASFNQKLIIML